MTFAEWAEVMLVFAKYRPEAKYVLVPEHDGVWTGHDVNPDELTAEECERLHRLGFNWDEDIPGWHKFT